MTVDGVMFCRHHIRMDRGCKECLGPTDWHAAWDDDLVQFARLLCEINATFSEIDVPGLCESMDLEPERIGELFDRADTVWEIAKGNREPMPRCEICGEPLDDDECLYREMDEGDGLDHLTGEEKP